MNSLQVCIVGLKCFDQIAGNPIPRYLGGIETQLVVLAKGLVKEGCQVSLITYDHGQEDALNFDGVTVFKTHGPDDGVPLMRWLHPRSTRLWKAMRRADANIYLQMGAGSETGRVALGCRMTNDRSRRFVFCLASNADYGARLTAGRFGWEGKLCGYGFRNADLIVAQTMHQRDGLRQALGLESQIIPMAIAPPCSRPVSGTASNGSNRVLWVGRITPTKRLEWLLEAAQRCPEIEFDLVGTPNTRSDYATRLLEMAARLPNVTVHGRLGAQDLSRLYQSGRLLCCTSSLEGFPTTFLEAWSCGLPVVTTFDPDQIVARHGLGRVAATLDDVVSHLRSVLDDQEVYTKLSNAAIHYYSENHAVGTVSRRFRLALEEVAARP